MIEILLSGVIIVLFLILITLLGIYARNDETVQMLVQIKEQLDRLDTNKDDSPFGVSCASGGKL